MLFLPTGRYPTERSDLVRTSKRPASEWIPVHWRRRQLPLPRRSLKSCESRLDPALHGPCRGSVRHHHDIREPLLGSTADRPEHRVRLSCVCEVVVDEYLEIQRGRKNGT